MPARTRNPQRAEARKLRESGLSYSRIAAQLGVSRQRAHQLVNQRLASEFVRLTPAQRRAMIAAQEGRCPLCLNVPDRFYEDHDHATGRVRGLLCFHCNRQLAARYKADWHRRVVAYLEADDRV